MEEAANIRSLAGKQMQSGEFHKSGTNWADHAKASKKVDL